MDKETPDAPSVALMHGKVNARCWARDETRRLLHADSKPNFIADKLLVLQNKVVESQTPTPDIWLYGQEAG